MPISVIHHEELISDHLLKIRVSTQGLLFKNTSGYPVSHFLSDRKRNEEGKYLNHRDSMKYDGVVDGRRYQPKTISGLVYSKCVDLIEQTMHRRFSKTAIVIFINSLGWWAKLTDWVVRDAI